MLLIHLGISFDSEGNIRAQNRGSYLQIPYSGQWKKFDKWLVPRTEILFDNLTDQYILFGEWCYAQHSVFYDRLPDWFLGFDIYDKKNSRFLSSYYRNELFEKMQITQVPTIASGVFSFAEISNFLSKSKFSNQPAEGLYLRFEVDGWLTQRAKLVRSTFSQSINQHWSRSVIKPNQLSSMVVV